MEVLGRLAHCAGRGLWFSRVHTPGTGMHRERSLSADISRPPAEAAGIIRSLQKALLGRVAGGTFLTRNSSQSLYSPSLQANPEDLQTVVSSGVFQKLHDMSQQMELRRRSENPPIIYYLSSQGIF
ncbi:uncharacterized protein LOC143659019 [Tamandua tetradactyla]|uniref:uncharacterized protein LOC143659019 n=1 Tax=Tamandua tetradactyla TaxID=48850 RepID=UPI004053D02F